MSLDGDWQSKFICAVRNSITNTSDVDKMAHETLKTYERALAPADAPKRRIRKYLKNLLGEQCVYLGVSPPGKADVLCAEYTFERPCFRSVFLDTAILRHAHTFDWGGLLRTFPDARALTYPKLTFKDTACVAVQLSHMCAGQVGGEDGCFLTFVCLWAYKAGVRCSAPTMRSPPDGRRVTFQGRGIFPPCLRMGSIRRTGFPLVALGMEFAKLPVTCHCAFLARTFEIRECAEIAISSYLGADSLLHHEFEDTHPLSSLWMLLEIGAVIYADNIR